MSVKPSELPFNGLFNNLDRCGKVIHFTPEEAGAHLARLLADKYAGKAESRRQDQRLEVYRCPYNKSIWHVGHSRRPKPSIEARRRASQRRRSRDTQRGHAIYESLRAAIEPLHAGRYIAIDPRSERYCIADTLVEAQTLGHETITTKALLIIEIKAPPPAPTSARRALTAFRDLWRNLAAWAQRRFHRGGKA